MVYISAKTKREFAVDPSGVLTRYRGRDTEIVLPDKVRVIGERVFGGNTALSGYKKVEKLIVPEGVVEIQKFAFSYSNLEEIVLPSTLKYIRYGAFYHCRNLKSITIPDGVEEIEESVFSMSGLEEIHLPKHLQRIDRNAFGGCRELKKVDFPETDPLEIDRKAFVGCTGLADDSGFFIFQNRLFAFDPDKYGSREYVDLPNNIVSVENEVFSNYDGIHITMPVNCPTWHIGIYSLRDKEGYSIISRNGSSLSFRNEHGEIVGKAVLEIGGENKDAQFRCITSIRSKKHGGFDFEQYDRSFEKLSMLGNQLEMALVRICYPYELSEEMEEVYRRFLILHSTFAGIELIDRNDIRSLKILENKKIFSAEEIKELLEYAQEQKRYDAVLELLNYQKTEFGTENTLRDLKLSEDNSAAASETKE
ncbi:MAG: leucine-rich repeat protein [Solobacterium sp.]|nr:leucine-rich repeat protein [Solobacterium sp.]